MRPDFPEKMETIFYSMMYVENLLYTPDDFYPAPITL